MCIVHSTLDVTRHRRCRESTASVDRLGSTGQSTSAGRSMSWCSFQVLRSSVSLSMTSCIPATIAGLQADPLKECNLPL